MSRAVIPRHGRIMHRANGEDPIPVLWHVKAFSDTKVVTVGDGARTIVITDDLGGTYLRSAEATVTTVSSSGALQIQVHNITNADDLLTTKIHIDASEYSSYTAATRSVVDLTGTPAMNKVLRGDRIRIDVDAAGTGAKGLEVLLEFGPQIVLLTP